MQYPFLQTYALDLRGDYGDWHKGRRYFGLWYIDVSDLAVADVCQATQKKLSAFLWSDYRRAFHITLFVNGFWVKKAQYADDFAYDTLTKQVNALRALRLSPFVLSIVGVDSFMASPYLAIAPSQNLTVIRQVLAGVHNEIAPSDYTPHITLGFYRANYAYTLIEKKLAQITVVPCEFLVNRLCFGVYRADESQGELITIKKVALT